MPRLSVFGGIDLQKGGRRLDAVLRQPKRTALLVYLATARPHGFHARDTLLALFWPESDDRRGRRSLRKALHFLRKHLGKNAIVSRGDDLSLSGIQCDAASFDAAVEAGRARNALELYRGDFLKGFHVSGSPEFERWLDAERKRYRRAAARLAWSLSEGEEAAGSDMEAVRFARRAHAIQPLDETGVRRLMELLDRLGDRAGALRVYEQAERLIREEVGVDPAPETRALHAEIVKEAGHEALSPLPPRPPTQAPELDTPVSAPRAPVAPAPTRSPQYARAGAVAAVIAFMATGAFLGFGPTEAPTGPESSQGAALAVLPFTVAGEEEGVWRDGMATLLATSFHGAAGIRALEPEYVVKLWQTDHGDAAPTSERLRAAARSLETDWIVSGSLTRMDGRLRLAAEAWSATDGRTAGPVVVEGARDSLFTLVDRLTVELLRNGIVRDDEGALPVELSRATTTSLAALQAYLEGERLWRSAKLRLAADAFGQAVRHDSTFALARYRLAVAQEWVPGDPVPHLRAAVRFAHRLHEREATLARGWLALKEGRIEEGLDTLRVLTDRNPDFGEGWLRLADGILHQGAHLLMPTAEFRTAMRQAIAVNPLAAEPYWHLMEDAFFREDSAAARALVEAYRLVDPNSPACIGYETAYGLAWGDEAMRARMEARLPSLDGEPRGPLNCALSVLHLVPPLRDAFETVVAELESPRRPEVERRRTRGRRISIDTRAGRIEDARGQLKLYLAENGGEARLAAMRLLMLDAVAYPESATATREALRVLEEAPTAEERFWIAASALAHGSWDRFAREIRALDRAATSLEGDAARQASDLARALETLSRLDGAGDDELQALTDLQAHMPGDLFLLREFIRLRIAEELLDRGQASRALRYVQSLGMDAYPVAAPGILAGARAWEALGDTAAAREAYQRFVRWWDRPDPELIHLKEEARAGLERLAAAGVTG